MDKRLVRWVGFCCVGLVWTLVASVASAIEWSGDPWADHRGKKTERCPETLSGADMPMPSGRKYGNKMNAEKMPAPLIDRLKPGRNRNVLIMPARPDELDLTPEVMPSPAVPAGETTAMRGAFGRLIDWLLGPSTPPRPYALRPRKSVRHTTAPQHPDTPARTRLRGISLGDDAMAQDARDFIVFRWLSSRSQAATITLLAGNPFTEPTPEEIEETRKFVREIKEAGMRVIYDADSRLAPVIAEEGDESALGISGQREGERVLLINNPLLRLNALGSSFSTRVIITPNSIVGQAVALEENIAVVWDYQGKKSTWDKWTQFIYRTKEPWRYWGAFVAHDYKTLKQYAGVYKQWRPKNFPLYDLNEMLGELTENRVQHILAFVDELAQGRAVLEKDPRTGAPLRGGVAFFCSGSKRHIEEYGELVESLATHFAKIGIPGVSGGSGGLMEVVNRAFATNGAPSIGIPMRGLHNETYVPKEVQTVTYETTDYATRLPLLFHRRGMLVFVPGRSGMMRELATALVQAAALGKDGPSLAFSDTKFYAELLEVFIESGMPEEITNRWHLVDNADELKEALLGPN